MIKSITRWWMHTPLNKKIAMIFIAITIATSLTVGLVSYRLSKEIITKASVEKTQGTVKTIANSINSFFQTADTTFISIYSNHDLRKALAQETGRDLTGTTTDKNIGAAVSLARQLNNSIIYLNIFGLNDYSYIDYNFNSSQNRNLKNAIAYYGSLGLTDDRKSALWLVNQKATIGTTDVHALTLVRYSRDIYSLQRTGIIVMGIAESALSKQFLSDSLFMVDKNGLIISHPNKAMLGTPLDWPPVRQAVATSANPGTVVFDDINGKKLFATYALIPETGWFLVSVDDYFQVFQNSYRLRYSIYLILSLSVVISGAAMLLVSKMLTTSLSRLFQTMAEAMAGDLSARFVVTGNDDVNRIGRHLNDMLQQIEEHLQYREASEKLARLSDLRLLQSQINPHLLYNTLDSVHYLLETDQFPKAATVLKAMSQFFKLSLSQGDYLIPLERELELVKHYLEIQRLCREKNIALTINCDAALCRLKVPKMIIQPIVENSIIHGLEGEQSHGKITIGIERVEDTVTITVTDDGVGITHGEAARINRLVNSRESGIRQKHYGLWNINHRLKDVFGPQSGLAIQSEFGEFTKTIITINNLPDGKTT